MVTLSKIIEQQSQKATQPNASFFQPQLTINERGDLYEQKADAVADKVMRMPTPSVNNNKMQLKLIGQNTFQNCNRSLKKSNWILKKYDWE